MRLTVIYNPKAGHRRWTPERIEDRMREAGHRATLVSSKEDWRAALDGDADAFVAAGGDGTVHKLARALAGAEVPLGIVPLGTANNIARAFGHLPGDDPFGPVAGWNGTERALRVARVSARGERLPFLEGMGGGAFARLLTRDPGKKKGNPLASLMAARKALVREVLEGPAIEGRVDLGGATIDDRWALLACLRLPSFGPSLTLAPDQAPDVHGLTVVGVRDDPGAREAFAWWLVTGEGDPTAFRLGGCEELELMVTGPVHVDDHLIEDGGEPHTLRVDPGDDAVRILV